MSQTGQQLIADEDVQAVLEFMQAKVATCKLVQVAQSVAEIGAVLWAGYRAEKFVPLTLTYSDQVGVLQPSANGSALARIGADGGSGVEAACP
jgi:hypothetical protein